jgi:hypothetical protein
MPAGGGLEEPVPLPMGGPWGAVGMVGRRGGGTCGGVDGWMGWGGGQLHASSSLPLQRASRAVALHRAPCTRQRQRRAPRLTERLAGGGGLTGMGSTCISGTSPVLEGLVRELVVGTGTREEESSSRSSTACSGGMHCQYLRGRGRGWWAGVASGVGWQ